MTTSRRPYLIRAIHEWICDNGHTPLIVVDATLDGVSVPAQHVQDGSIVLNVSYAATSGLELGNDSIRFTTRFGGTSFAVTVPCEAVMVIFARETNEGLAFSGEQGTPPEPDNSPPRPSLKVVK